MNLEAEILKEHSKRQSVRIARWIGNDAERFAELMTLFLHGEYRITQRAAWNISHCAESQPHIIKPWLAAMVKKAQEPGVHDAVKRNVVRILEGVEIPPPLLGRAVSMCFDYLSDDDVPIAVKAYAMRVLAKIARRKHGIRHELEIVIEQMLPYAGAALRSCGHNVLHQLHKE